MRYDPSTFSELDTPETCCPHCRGLGFTLYERDNPASAEPCGCDVAHESDQPQSAAASEISNLSACEEAVRLAGLEMGTFRAAMKINLDEFDRSSPPKNNTVDENSACAEAVRLAEAEMGTFRAAMKIDLNDWDRHPRQGYSPVRVETLSGSISDE